jgi:hypothetical protein
VAGLKKQKLSAPTLGSSAGVAISNPAHIWSSILGMLVVRDFATHDLAVEGQGLQHDVESFAILVVEHQAKVEPEIVLTFASDHRIRAVRRLSRFTFLRHDHLLCADCDFLRVQALVTHGLVPASAESQFGDGGDCQHDTCGRVLVKSDRVIRW